MRRWMIVLAAGSLAGCLHTRAVGKGQAESEQNAKGKVVAAPEAVGTKPESVFKPGATKKLQKALSDRGYAARETGEIDEATRKALERFQRDNDMAPTGYPDLETVGKLGLDPSQMYLAGSTKKEEDTQKREQHREAERGRQRE